MVHHYHRHISHKRIITENDSSRYAVAVI
jgi:hypothetical protein